MRSFPRPFRSVPAARRAVAAVAAAALLATALAACSSSGGGGGGDGAKDPIRLGATGSLTGPLGSSCIPQVAGAKGWFDKVNKEGGIDGRKIEWTILDDGGDPQRGLSNTRRLISDGVDAVFANCGSPGNTASLPAIQAADLANFFPGSVADAVLRPAQKNLFASLPLFDQQIATVIPFALKKSGPGTVAMVYLDGYSKNMVPSAEWAVKQGGSSLVASIGVPGTTTDWGPTIIQLKNLNPDYVMLVLASAASGPLVAEMAKQGYAPKKGIIGPYNLADPLYIKTAGAAAVGTLTGSSIAPWDDPRADDCNATLPKDTEPTAYTVIGCGNAQAMVKILQDTVKLDGGITTANLVKATEKADFSSVKVLPGLKYTGTSLLIRAMVMYRVAEGGKLEQIDDQLVDVPDDSAWSVLK